MTSILDSIPLAKNVGITVVQQKRGYVKLRMPISPSNSNHFRAIYAGAMYTLAEIPGGILFFSFADSAKYYPVIVETNTRFLKPAVTTIEVELSLSEEDITRITQELEQKGRSRFELNVEIKNEQGVVVGTSMNKYMGLSKQLAAKSRL
eukprot:c17976_g1_i1.p1 GENE.c17976_g1_i1~~c17976_g1_i1.p1  ORF type:complete len:162 (-),score=21.96 c17976_g1_i1:470-916(-)